MTTTVQIGDQDTATQVAIYHLNGVGAESTRLAEGDAMGQIGKGSHRTVYVDYETDIVYKVGLDSANREEHRVLTTAREAGEDWALATTLYEVEVEVFAGITYLTEIVTVIAMPHLPEDGSVPGAAELIIPAAADLNTGNVHSNGGRLWLIDAGGM